MQTLRCDFHLKFPGMVNIPEGIALADRQRDLTPFAFMRTAINVGAVPKFEHQEYPQMFAAHLPPTLGLVKELLNKPHVKVTAPSGPCVKDREPPVRWSQVAIHIPPFVIRPAMREALRHKLKLGPQKRLLAVEVKLSSYSAHLESLFSGPAERPTDGLHLPASRASPS